jgi:glycosyltransferase involved in cell wall biosynthesis
LISYRNRAKPDAMKLGGSTITAGELRAEGLPGVAYVMTHYPRVALTFISGEIDALEQLGLCIHPMAMNLPDEMDMKAPGAAERVAATVYLKTSKWSLLRDFAFSLGSHPLRMFGLVGLALGSARFDIGLMARRLAHLMQATSVARMCRGRGIRHLHAHFGQAPATIAWFASEVLNCTAATSRVTWSFTIHGFQDFVDEAVARLDLKAASAVFIVCISDFTRSQLCRVSSPTLWPRFQVVRCGIDLAAIPFQQPLPAGPIVTVISVGRLSPEKGQVILLEALARVRKEGIDARLLLVGGGPYERAIRQQIAQLGLADCVDLAGELTPKQVIERLRLCDLFCIPSFSEGLPVSMMEAMAVGVPVVATSIAGIPELAVDGQTALTVPPANPEALAHSLRRLATDDELRSRLARNARSRVEQMHDLNRNAAQLLRLFQQRTAMVHEAG